VGEVPADVRVAVKGDGDQVEVEVENLKTLRNRVIAP
jgi:hypothetical protein